MHLESFRTFAIVPQKKALNVVHVAQVSESTNSSFSGRIPLRFWTYSHFKCSILTQLCHPTKSFQEDSSVIRLSTAHLNAQHSTFVVLHGLRKVFQRFVQNTKWISNEVMPGEPEWKKLMKIFSRKTGLENDELGKLNRVVKIFHFSWFSAAWFVLCSKNNLTWSFSCYLDPIIRQ